MKQRLGIAGTLLGDPRIVILDEPTNGLDPAGQREIRSLIPRLAHEGRAVVVASHLLHEVQEVCDRVAILRAGRLMYVGEVEALLTGGGFRVQVATPAQAAAVLRAQPYVEQVQEQDGQLVVFAAADKGPDISRALSDAGHFVSAMVPERGSLEDVFLELTNAEEPDATAAAR